MPALNGNPFAVSRNTFTGDPYGDTADYHSYRSTLQFEKILNDNWTLRIGEMSLFYNTPSTTTFLDNGSTGANGLLNSPLIPRDQTVAAPFDEQNNDILETLGGNFNGRFFAHKAVIGAEQDWFITNHDTFTQTTNLLGGVRSLRSMSPSQDRSPSVHPLPLPPRTCSTTRVSARTASASSPRTSSTSRPACTCSRAAGSTT